MWSEWVGGVECMDDPRVIRVIVGLVVLVMVPEDLPRGPTRGLVLVVVIVVVVVVVVGCRTGHVHGLRPSE